MLIFSNEQITQSTAEADGYHGRLESFEALTLAIDPKPRWYYNLWDNTIGKYEPQRKQPYHKFWLIT